MRLWYVTGKAVRRGMHTYVTEVCFMTFGDTADEAIARVVVKARNYHLDPYRDCEWTADEETDGCFELKDES